MLLTFEGAETFYTMNFGCLTENFDANLDQYKNGLLPLKSSSSLNFSYLIIL